MARPSYGKTRGRVVSKRARDAAAKKAAPKPKPKPKAKAAPKPKPKPAAKKATKKAAPKKAKPVAKKKTASKPASRKLSHRRSVVGESERYLTKGYKTSGWAITPERMAALKKGAKPTAAELKKMRFEAGASATSAKAAKLAPHGHHQVAGDFQKSRMRLKQISKKWDAKKKKKKGK